MRALASSCASRNLLTTNLRSLPVHNPLSSCPLSIFRSKVRFQRSLQSFNKAFAYGLDGLVAKLAAIEPAFSKEAEQKRLRHKNARHAKAGPAWQQRSGTLFRCGRASVSASPFKKASDYLADAARRLRSLRIDPPLQALIDKPGVKRRFGQALLAAVNATRR